MSDDSHTLEIEHPGPKTYAKIAAILCLITLAEFGAFYSEILKPIFVPLLIVMSGTKFLLVVLFYMHLKFDHQVYRFILMAAVGLAFVAFLWLLALYTFSHPIQPV